MKIFQIGFNKCGTKSIHHFLRRNGVSSVHWNYGHLACRIFQNLSNGDDLLAGYERFDAFTDMEFIDPLGACFLEAYKLYPYFAAQYPDAVFILNTRDREAWIRSRLSHGKYASLQKTFFGVSSDEEITEIWRTEWERHHSRVIEFFADGRHRFLLCKIETDLPHLLSEGLPELELDRSVYELRHRTSERNNSAFYKLRQRFRRMLKRLLG